MSQSGNAPLARQEPTNALPSPSPSSSDLPDLAEPTSNCPRTLIAAVRDVLALNKAKNKKPTLNDYKLCLDTLDSLDRLLDAGDRIEASLKQFKAELLADLSASAPRGSYACATASPPPSSSSLPPPAPHASKTANTKPKTREVTVVLDEGDGVLALPLPEIKLQVEGALAAAGIEKLKGVTIRGVKVLPKARLLVAVDSDQAASLLRQTAAHWVPKLARKGSLLLPRCQIVLDSVPTTFNPKSPTASIDLYAKNRTEAPSSNLLAFEHEPPAAPSKTSEPNEAPPLLHRAAKAAGSLAVGDLRSKGSRRLSTVFCLLFAASFRWSHRIREWPTNAAR
ncbi:hypothetical protein C8R47DRAFT_1078907 [Mycena vitilis]|nr:hypothetical protein C8R47DRAFT_1078907 [Mycena vitilis]